MSGRVDHDLCRPTGRCYRDNRRTGVESTIQIKSVGVRNGELCAGKVFLVYPRRFDRSRNDELFERRSGVRRPLGNRRRPLKGLLNTRATESHNDWTATGGSPRPRTGYTSYAADSVGDDGPRNLDRHAAWLLSSKTPNVAPAVTLVTTMQRRRPHRHNRDYSDWTATDDGTTTNNIEDEVISVATSTLSKDSDTEMDIKMILALIDGSSSDASRGLIGLRHGIAQSHCGVPGKFQGRPAGQRTSCSPLDRVSSRS